MRRRHRQSLTKVESGGCGGSIENRNRSCRLYNGGTLLHFLRGRAGGGKIIGQTVLLQVNGSFVVVCTETVNDSELFHHSVLVLSRGNGSYRIPVG